MCSIRCRSFTNRHAPAAYAGTIAPSESRGPTPNRSCRIAIGRTRTIRSRVASRRMRRPTSQLALDDDVRTTPELGHGTTNLVGIVGVHGHDGMDVSTQNALGGNDRMSGAGDELSLLSLVHVDRTRDAPAFRVDQIQKRDAFG